MVLLAAAVIPWATSILYRYSPAEHDFYPRCVFHWLTGWHCPGCGATRCLYSLLHGDLAQALAYNPLFLIASPFLIYGGLRLGYEMATGKKAPGKIHTPTWTMPVVLAILLAFWIARNIDAFPFSVLAPHVL
jgi:hypothetical protein